MTTRQIEENEINTKYPASTMYRTKYDCTNCGWSGSLSFKKGTVAPPKAVCPTCICYSAKKSLPYRAPAPMMKDPIGPGGIPPWPRDLPMPSGYDPLKPDYTHRQPTWIRNDVDHCTGFGFES